jgi:hypothetical protein
LGYRDGDIVLRQSDEAASVDDRVGNRFVRCNDDIVDGSDAFILVVKYRLAQDLAFGAPA